MKNFAIKYGKIIHMISVPFFIILGVGLSFLYKTPYFIFGFISIILLTGLFTYIEILWHDNIKIDEYYNVKLTREEIANILDTFYYAEGNRVEQWPLFKKLSKIAKYGNYEEEK